MKRTRAESTREGDGMIPTNEGTLELAPVRQQLYSAPLADVPGAVRSALEAAGLADVVRPGQRIAVTAGSRGIGNITLILKTVVAALRERGAEPFVVPAMGSHGGATDAGQAALLADTFGIHALGVGAPVLSSMEVVELGRTPERGIPVYLDRNAAAADGIVVVNRVKAHTDFRGPWESGLLKMIAIGLGKRAQAESIHAHGAWGLRHLIPEVARAKIALSPIRIGLAILEDGYDETCAIVGLPAAAIEAEEPPLLERAKTTMARLPFPELDLLIIDQIGKEISGAGLDPNVIGRLRIEGEPEPESPRVERILLRDLTELTHGNGVGTGLADIITRRLLDKIDWEVTNTNSIVSGFTMRTTIPIVAENDREAIGAALFLLRRRPPAELRVARIRDTLHLERLQASPPLLHEDLRAVGVVVEGPAAPLRFDSAGNIA
jgi:hypothetical protein